MKTKIIIALIAVGVAVSLGAAKSGKKQPNAVVQSTTASVPPSEPIGGFVSEDH